ncbi:sigma-70 family RNA polymerase sigma factor [Actinokineospora sp. NBRC 105648]|uniref:RNA polymerase sigma factor n=1 Tax=Actinokineospora sp. NBRC 105648 TaxID=3032206 RepID=UPI0025557401|nr:sigma-70 family RNA polymerase sigma factor [Actinokineospora sp. NBRC 105648]
MGAFEVLVRRNHSAAHRMALLSGAGSDAEDVVQDAFVRVFDGLAGFRLDAAFRPWLLQTVVNLARDLHRSRARRLRLQDRVALLGEHRGEADHRREADPQRVALLADRDRALWSALWALPEKDRQVLGCRFLLELSERETAEVLGWPLGSVKSRTSRALTRLRELIAPEPAESAEISEVSR